MGQDRLLYRFCLCILLQFYQQMSGGNLISVYSTVIFQEGLRMDSETSRILSGGTLTCWLRCHRSIWTTVCAHGERHRNGDLHDGARRRDIVSTFEFWRTSRQCLLHFLI